MDSGAPAKRTGISKGEFRKGLRQLVKLGIFRQEGNEAFCDVLMEISARGNQELENSDKIQKSMGLIGTFPQREMEKRYPIAQKSRYS